VEQEFTVVNYSVYFWNDPEVHSKYVHLNDRLHSEYHCGEDSDVYHTLFRLCSLLCLELISGKGNYAYLAGPYMVEAVISGTG
jgi:hypothetical protein